MFRFSRLNMIAECGRNDLSRDRLIFMKTKTTDINAERLRSAGASGWIHGDGEYMLTVNLMSWCRDA